jgi:hypothetical protein
LTKSLLAARREPILPRKPLILYGESFVKLRQAAGRRAILEERRLCHAETAGRERAAPFFNPALPGEPGEPWLKPRRPATARATPWIRLRAACVCGAVNLIQILVVR